MKLLWLNAGLLLPLDKGGKLRTWHVMRHLARRHDITYLSFADRRRARPTARHARGVLDGSKQSRAPIPRRAPGASTPMPPLPRRSAPYAVAKYRSDAYRARARTAARRGALRRDRLRFPAAGRQPAARGCPARRFSSRTTSKPRSGAATPRHADNPLSQLLLTQQWQRMLRFEARALSRFDRVLAVRRPTGGPSSGSTREPARAGARRARPASTPTYFTPSPTAPASARTWSSPARWTGCPTKTA